MKSKFKIVVVMILCMLFIGGYGMTDSNTDEKKSYVGQYDENMTPENSCVFFFLMPENNHVKFVQTNPSMGVDIQTLKPMGDHGVIISKPCKPGSSYMIREMRGGNFNSYWFMSFGPGEKFFTFDIPETPGIYFYGFFWGEDIAKKISHGEQVDLEKLKKIKYTKPSYKTAKKYFERFYGGTPWYDAFLEQKEIVLKGGKNK
nr:hypothetical protein [uncultured Treponema sp.]